jgi:hypothetical protein
VVQKPVCQDTGIVCGKKFRRRGAGQASKQLAMFRPRYLGLALLILGLEIFIGVFVRDTVVRPFLGDVLVVVLLYALLRAFVPAPPSRLAWGVLLFSFLIETLQYFDYVALLHLENNRLLSVMLGRTFSWSDFLAYLSGFLLVLVVDRRTVT